MPRKPRRSPSAPDFTLLDLAPGYPGDLGKNALIDDLRFTEFDGEPVALPHGRVLGCRFEDVACEVLDLQGTTMRESEVLRPSVVTVRAARGEWSDVRVRGGRIGVLEAYEASWSTVEITGVKASYLNLRAASLTDLTLTDCRIEELDLADARVERATLDGSQITRLTVQGATLEGFDLRGAAIEEIVGIASLKGAIISSDQLIDLAPALARAVGLAVEN